VECDFHPSLLFARVIAKTDFEWIADLRQSHGEMASFAEAGVQAFNANV
jgi:hypothetical protein